MVQAPGREVMVKVYAQHTALVIWLPPTHLPFITVAAMNTPKRNPRYALFDIFGVSV